MEFTKKAVSPEKQRGACVLAGVYEPRRLSDSAKRLDEASRGLITRLAKRGDISGKLGQTLLLHNVQGVAAERVLLVGCGRERELDAGRFHKVIDAAVQALTPIGAGDATSFLGELKVKDRDLYWKSRHTVLAAEEALYRFDRMKSGPKEKTRLKRMALAYGPREHADPVARGIRHGQAMAAGVNFSKDLANLPGNICTPSYLAGQARELAKQYPSISVRVLDPNQMKRLGMGALLAVAQGSRQSARLIVLEYRHGSARQAPVALVGKGVTFDSGGISIKSAPAMDEMKFDMSGAASVLGALRAAAQLELPLPIVGIIPATENLPDGQAVKPGDIVTSMSGQTVEILNTDAEGRLILCDALTYAERFKPKTVIDIATLTGACVVALGKHASGLYSNDEALAQALLSAGDAAQDRAWQMPLWDDYQQQLDSRFADMANIGGREAGSVTAACFLSRFTKKYTWAHLDIAGTAWLTGKVKGSTGRPVALLVQYLLNAGDDAS